MKLDTLKTVFYVYSDATMAALMAVACIVELLCTLAVPEVFHPVTITASILFGLAAVYLATAVYVDAKKSFII